MSAYQIGDLVTVDSPEHGSHGETGCLVAAGTDAVPGWDYLMLVAFGPGGNLEFAAVSTGDIQRRNPQEDT